MENFDKSENDFEGDGKLQYMPKSSISNFEAIAIEAAVADGLISSNAALKLNGDLKNKKAGLRRGKWTAEEEFYANRLIYEFKLGLLPLTDGTTLRTFLSKLLNCDPMRISKKFVGQNCIGKQVFRRRQQELEKLSPEQIEVSRRELAELERRFLERVAQTNRIKTTGGIKTGKDEKLDYEDENGNIVTAPWMLPPEDDSVPTSNRLSIDPKEESFKGTLKIKTPKEIRFNQSSYPTNQYEPIIYKLDNNENQSTLQRISSLDILCSIEENRLPISNNDNNYPPFNNFASMYKSSTSFPWTESSAIDIANNDYSSGTLNGFGSLMEWPSMNNLVAAAETLESVDDLTSLGLAANNSFSMSNINLSSFNLANFNTEPTQSTNVLKQNKGSDDIGYPIDETDAISPSINKTKLITANLNAVNHIYNLKENNNSYPISDNNDNSNNNDNSSLAILNKTQQNNNSKEYTNQKITNNEISEYLQKTKQMHNPVSNNIPNNSIISNDKNNNEAKKSIVPKNPSIMPRNSSVDNFWMLVDMGDLPQPDKHVLSETLWQGSEEGKHKINSNSSNNDNKKRNIPTDPMVLNSHDNNSYDDVDNEEMKLQKKVKLENNTNI